MINEIRKIPVTASSYPFQSANPTCNLESLGYVEDELIMSGTANIYEEGYTGKLTVIHENAPYTTRLLVRRPLATEKYSGNVVVEILNASAMMDIDRMWINSWKYFTRNGDIFIGISSKGHVVDALKLFDSVRYSEINWNNPMPEREPPANRGKFPFLPKFEAGLFWDMLIDLAKLLRTDSTLNPIVSYGKSYIYLTGWSQSGSYLCRVVNTFSQLPENNMNGPLFDGYLAGGCGPEVAPLNSYSEGPDPLVREGMPQYSVAGAKQPYIAINTESENRFANWSGDFDLPDYKFRTYQIPGSSHDSEYSLLTYYRGRLSEDLTRMGRKLTFDGVDGEPMNNPFEFIFNAAFRNLYSWVRDGVPAPHSKKIETYIVDERDIFGIQLRNQTDIFGNVKGGIRNPGVDCPIGTYTPFSKTADGGLQAMFGHILPFRKEKLYEIYGSLEHYRSLVEQKAQEMIALGFLLKEDFTEIVDIYVNQAKKYGLT